MVLAFKKFGTGAPQWLSWLVSAFGSGHNLRVLGSSPTSGSLFSGESASPSPFAPLPHLFSLSLSNKSFFFFLKKLGT